MDYSIVMQQWWKIFPEIVYRVTVNLVVCLSNGRNIGNNKINSISLRQSLKFSTAILLFIVP